MEKNSSNNKNTNARGERFVDKVVHDEELGVENVELVDSEWADFERALR